MESARQAQRLAAEIQRTGSTPQKQAALERYATAAAAGMAVGGPGGAAIATALAAIPGADQVTKPVADIVKGAVGWLTGKEDKGKKKQADLAKQAVSDYEQMRNIAPSSYELAPDRTHILSPMDYLLGQSSAGMAQADTSSQRAQLDAINALAGWDNNTLRDMQRQGLTGAEQNMYSNMVARSNREQAAAEQAALANMAARGRSGGNQELLARLTGAGNRGAAASDLGAQMGMNAQNRAMGAADAYSRNQIGAQSNSGALAGQRRLQSFNEAFQRGQANDQRSQYNVDTRRQTDASNAAAKNRLLEQQALARQQAYDNYYRNTASLNNARLGQGAIEGQRGSAFGRSMERIGQVVDTGGQVAKTINGMPA